MSNNLLKDKKLEAYIPASLVTSKGIARGIPTDISVEEIVKEAKTEIRIIEARRFKKRIENAGAVDYEDTETVVLTFQGKNLPRFVRIDYWDVRIKVYVSSVMQCFNCLRYGHTKKQCRSKTRCSRCSEEHQREDCTAGKTTCLFCKGEHGATQRNCPEQIRQKNIKYAMATENLSYYDARKQFPINYMTDVTHQKPHRSQFTGDFRDFHRSLKHKEPSLISVSQRARHTSQPILQSRPTKSYANVAGIPKRKEPSSPDSEYDREEHNRCLFRSPSRTPSQGAFIPQTTSTPLSFRIKEVEEVEPVPLMEVIRNALHKTNLSQQMKNHVMEEIEKTTQIQNSPSPISDIEYQNTFPKTQITTQDEY